MKMQISAAAAVALALVPLSQAVGGGLIYNGDFEGGNVGFSSEYRFVGNERAGSGGLYDSGTYVVTDNANAYQQFFDAGGDHTSGDGLMMAVNGAETGLPRGGYLQVWSQLLDLEIGQDYEFSFWAKSLYGANPAELRVNANGVGQNADMFVLPETAGEWTRYSVTITGFTFRGTVELSIVDESTELVGNDFAIDDIGLSPVPAPGVAGMAGVLVLGVRRARR